MFRGQEEMAQTNDIRGVLLRIAQSAGLSEDQFTACISDEKALKALNDRVQKATTEEKIESTPTFIVNGKKMVGEQTMADFDAAIQPLLK